MVKVLETFILNLFGITLNKDFTKTYPINCDQVVKEAPFTETSHLKELKIKSKLLSDFHKKDIYIAGAVSLPDDYYTNSDNHYPVIFSIFGFGANL